MRSRAGNLPAHADWSALWSAPRPPRGTSEPPPRRPAVLLAPEEKALLRDSAQAAGLPRAVALRAVRLVEAGVLPLDPLALNQRIKGLESLLRDLGISGSGGGGGDRGSALARLLSTPDGPALLSRPRARLERQLSWLAARLPGYRPEWLLTALPRWSLHGPGHVAKRLEELERLYQQHLGVPFPREVLGAPGHQWKWLMALSTRTKTVHALELILL